ncbi:ATP-dependent DNA helicase RecG [Actinotalea sp. AC32]|nr:ATP-dependent DNA helicase RecG [Actinotalea sp. AC32]
MTVPAPRRPAPAGATQPVDAGDRLPGPLDAPLTRQVGVTMAKKLEALGLRTSGDLLRHLPRRYADAGSLTDLASVAVGEHVSILARVRSARSRQMQARRGAMLEAVVTDGNREMSLTFFARGAGALRSHESRLRPGRVGVFSGVVKVYRGMLQLTHPDYHVVGVDADDEAAALVEASRPMPIYPASAGAETWRIQKAVRTVLDPLRPGDVPEPVPVEVRARHGLQTAFQAMHDLHAPYDDDQWRRGQRYARFEEAFVLQVALARRRALVADQDAVARPGASAGTRGILAAFDDRLPFTLTQGQREVGERIAADLARPHPMQRLLQGEVGSGKTVVALRAMLQVVDSGGQAALLAPTEVLAAQHLRTLRTLLGELAEEGMLGAAERATRVVLLTGSLPASARKEALLDAASGRAGIVVGTHALLGDQVRFADLGLVVVDEQHRFGVEQRDVLRSRGGTTPHLLVMTATPIPRTVAMTVFGDLETSTLAEVPAGRPGVTTHVVPADRPSWLERAWQRVREEVDAGHRVYVVCPRITADDDVGAGPPGGPDATDVTDDADLLADEPPGTVPGQDDRPARPPLRAVEEVAAQLRTADVLDGVQVGVLHGRLPASEKEEAVRRFASGEVPVLVSTTVVEVGVDVPEATVMVVLDADRFGLSQLHQLRGRVGRGTAPGLCLLVSAAPDGSDASVRLRTLAETTDGFRLASVDLELRKEGDVLGASQSGSARSLRILRVVHDAEVIAAAREDAEQVVAADPDLVEWPDLRRAIETWLDPEREEFLERT